MRRANRLSFMLRRGQALPLRTVLLVRPPLSAAEREAVAASLAEELKERGGACYESEVGLSGLGCDGVPRGQQEASGCRLPPPPPATCRCLPPSRLHGAPTCTARHTLSRQSEWEEMGDDAESVYEEEQGQEQEAAPAGDEEAGEEGTAGGGGSPAAGEGDDVSIQGQAEGDQEEAPSSSGYSSGKQDDAEQEAGGEPAPAAAPAQPADGHAEVLHLLRHLLLHTTENSFALTALEESADITVGAVQELRQVRAKTRCPRAVSGCRPTARRAGPRPCGTGCADPVHAHAHPCRTWRRGLPRWRRASST